MISKKYNFVLVFFIFLSILMFFYPSTYKQFLTNYNPNIIFYYIIIIQPLFYMTLSYCLLLLFHRFLIKEIHLKRFIFSSIGLGIGGVWLFLTLCVLMANIFHLNYSIILEIQNFLTNLTRYKFFYIIIGISLYLSNIR